MIAISRLAYAATAAVALAAIPAHGLAQSTKVLFLPGKGEGSSDWSSTVSAVQSSGLQLSSVGAADLPGGSVFPSQLSWLTTYYSSSLGSNSVVIVKFPRFSGHLQRLDGDSRQEVRNEEEARTESV